MCQMLSPFFIVSCGSSPHLKCLLPRQVSESQLFYDSLECVGYCSLLTSPLQFLPGAQGCFLKWSLPLIVSLVALGTFMGACTYFSSSLMDCKIYKSRTIHSHVHTCSTVRVWGGWGWDPGWSEVSWRRQCQTMSKIHMDLQWEDGIPSRVH